MIADNLDSLTRQAQQMKASLVMEGTNGFSINCREISNRLTTILPLASVIQHLTNLSSVPDGIINAISSFETLVSALPEPTKQEELANGLQSHKSGLRTGANRFECTRSLKKALRALEEYMTSM
jgi:hypothetical protein